MERLIADLRAQAGLLGFEGLGIAEASPSDHGTFFRKWLDRKFHGEMAYLARPDAISRREDLRGTMEDVRSVVVVTQNYFQVDPPGVPEDSGRGVMARYARGQDYHDVVKGRLQELSEWLRSAVKERGLAEDVRGFTYVDTGPLLERELGVRAGLGWFGKNTMLIHPKRGSFFFLGILLLDLPLVADPPFRSRRCGSCRACLDACPTGALLGQDERGAPVMDATRCISYLTIEHKGAIPRGLRSAVGNRIFGCDICQEVCPFTRKFSQVSEEPAYKASSWTDGPSLVELMALSEDEFSSVFSGSPVKRARRRGLLRNVAVALGNWGSSDAVPALSVALEDPEPLVRGHAAWALGQILSRVGIPGGRKPEVTEALLCRRDKEDDSWVSEEISAALRS